MSVYSSVTAKGNKRYIVSDKGMYVDTLKDWPELVAVEEVRMALHAQIASEYPNSKALREYHFRLRDNARSRRNAYMEHLS